jgi:hypothetical protein
MTNAGDLQHVRDLCAPTRLLKAPDEPHNAARRVPVNRFTTTRISASTSRA